MAPRHGEKRQMTEKQKIVALTNLEDGWKIQDVAAKFGVDRKTIWRPKKKAEKLEPGEYAPKRKEGSGAEMKFTLGMMRRLKKIVTDKPFISARVIKTQYPGFENVSIRRIQYHCQKTLNMPARRPAKKPLLTEAAKAKRLAFCQAHIHWTEQDWEKVMFSDESNFFTIRSTAGRQTVRRPSGSDRFKAKYTRKTVKYPPGCMVWGCFSAKGRGGIFFVPKKKTMNSVLYCEVLRDHLFGFMERHQCEVFLQDGAKCHTSSMTMALLNQQPFRVCDWPGNLPDLNPIENLWNWMKDQLQEKKVTSVPALQEEVKRLWCMGTPVELLKKLSDSMPRRLQAVIDAGGEMTKY